MKQEKSSPADADVEAFLEKLRAFRDSLPEREQRLLNAMFFAAIGKDAAGDEDVGAYWLHARGSAMSIVGTPWGGAYGVYGPSGPVSSSNPFLLDR